MTTDDEFNNRVCKIKTRTAINAYKDLDEILKEEFSCRAKRDFLLDDRFYMNPVIVFDTQEDFLEFKLKYGNREWFIG